MPYMGVPEPDRAVRRPYIFREILYVCSEILNDIQMLDFPCINMQCDTGRSGEHGPRLACGGLPKARAHLIWNCGV